MKMTQVKKVIDKIGLANEILEKDDYPVAIVITCYKCVIKRGGEKILKLIKRHLGESEAEYYSYFNRPKTIERLSEILNIPISILNKANTEVLIEEEKERRMPNRRCEKYIIEQGYVKEQITNATKAEKEFKQDLDEAGITYGFQVPIGKYIADFVLYNNIVVEIDGGYHNLLNQQYKDQLKISYLNKMGYNVIHITNEEVHKQKYPPIIDRLLF